MGYEGHVMPMEPEEKERETIAAAGVLAEAHTLVEASGIEVGCTRGGGTGNYWITLKQGLWDHSTRIGCLLPDRERRRSNNRAPQGR